MHIFPWHVYFMHIFLIIFIFWYLQSAIQCCIVIIVPADSNSQSVRSDSDNRVRAVMNTHSCSPAHDHRYNTDSK